MRVALRDLSTTSTFAEVDGATFDTKFELLGVAVLVKLTEGFYSWMVAEGMNFRRVSE